MYEEEVKRKRLETELSQFQRETVKAYSLNFELNKLRKALDQKR